MTDESLQEAEELETSATSEEQVQNVEDQTDDGQEENQETEHADDNAARRNKVPAGKRIRQLTRKFRESEREKEQLLKRLDDLEKRLGPAPAPARPNLEDFDSQEAYEDALFDWRDTVKQTENPAEKPTDEPQVTSPIDEVLEEELDEIGEDAYHLVMEGDWKCSKDMMEYIMSSEVRANLAYHLATNEDIAEKISKMPAIRAARELEKVEAEIASNLNKGTTEQTINTPPPPLDTSAPRSVAIEDQDKMSTEQWLAMRNKQLYGQ